MVLKTAIEMIYRCGHTLVSGQAPSARIKQTGARMRCSPINLYVIPLFHVNGHGTVYPHRRDLKMIKSAAKKHSPPGFLDYNEDYIIERSETGLAEAR
jgi:hypothetical protein